MEPQKLFQFSRYTATAYLFARGARRASLVSDCTISQGTQAHWILCAATRSSALLARGMFVACHGNGARKHEETPLLPGDASSCTSICMCMVAFGCALWPTLTETCRQWDQGHTAGRPQ